MADALTRIDTALSDWAHLSIVAQADVVDLLLDIRNYLAATEQPGTEELEGSTP